MKTDIENVQLACDRHSVDAVTTAKIINDLQEAAKIEQEERKATSGENKKQKFLVVVEDPSEFFKEHEFTGFAVTIDEDSSEFSFPEKLTAAVAEYNRSDKGRKDPVERVGIALETLPAKLLKEHGIRVKHREAAYILPIQKLKVK